MKEADTSKVEEEKTRPQIRPQNTVSEGHFVSLFDNSDSTSEDGLNPYGIKGDETLTWSFGEKEMVPRTGVEPAHLAAREPKSRVSTNSTIWAHKIGRSDFMTGLHSPFKLFLNLFLTIDSNP